MFSDNIAHLTETNLIRVNQNDQITQKTLTYK